MSNFLFGALRTAGLFAFAGKGLCGTVSGPVLVAARRVEMRAGAFGLLTADLFDI
ncbi:hypothetical protein [Paraburkholderia sediminicola]|jgi:hypothetical protein|uniref:hypothetical protein n=1 Tax=Paraburkholderia sediminicola TaxID=458836 RepID=UPI0038B79EC8